MTFQDRNKDEIIKRGLEMYAKLRKQADKYTHAEIMALIYKQVDYTTGSPEMQEQISCGRGCSACCNREVLMSKFEAEHLKHMIAGSVKPNQERLDQQAGKDYQGLKWAQRACSLLDDQGNCTIYENRPIFCRTHNSTEDPKNCQEDIHNPGEIIGHRQAYHLDLEAVQMALYHLSGGNIQNLANTLKQLENESK